MPLIQHLGAGGSLCFQSQPGLGSKSRTAKAWLHRKTLSQKKTTETGLKLAYNPSIYKAEAEDCQFRATVACLNCHFFV